MFLNLIEWLLEWIQIDATLKPFGSWGYFFLEPVLILGGSSVR